MSITSGWVLFSFVLYFAVMIAIGVFNMKTNTSSEDYFLGGRSLGAFVAALSAQASDMSGWLLMGLPGSIYAFGTGQVWIAVGLFAGTVLNWLLIATRLRRYTIRANNAVTLPQYFQNRFQDNSRLLLLFSSLAILIFFLVYTASAFAAGGKLFSTVFGLDYHVALSIGAVIILTYTLLGGFSAVCDTDFVQGTVMLIALVIVPLMALRFMGGDLSGASNVGETFLNAFYDDGKPLTGIGIVSQLAWGLGYCGMPHILVRFMAVKNDRELNKAKAIGIIWVALSLGFACLIGIVGRAFLSQDLVASGDSEKVFMFMIMEIFMSRYAMPVVGGIFLCGILAAIMSTADSQLLVTASGVTEDLYQGFMEKKLDGKKAVWLSRVVVLCVALIAYVIALDPDSSIMGLVSDAWAGLGSAFGPAVLLSLYWRRVNREGTAAGIITGAVTVIIWDYIPCIGGKTPAAATGLYSLLVGFCLSLLAIVAVSLLTKEPGEEILATFDDVNRNTEQAD